MKIYPSKYGWIPSTIICAISWMRYFLPWSKHDDNVWTGFLVLLAFDLTFLFFAWRQYKIIALENDTLIFSYRFLGFFLKDLVFDIKKINNMKVLEWGSGTASPYIEIHFINSKGARVKKAIWFRMRSKRKEFLSLLQELRTRGIVVETIGPIWNDQSQN